MNTCFWCRKNKELYAYNLCLNCYRWFLKYTKEPIEYCAMCEKVITKRQKGLCTKCRKMLEDTATPKRIQNLSTKYESISTYLQTFLDSEDAFEALKPYFKPKQQKILTVLVQRFYEHKTLDEIGKSWEKPVTREYIRQCEDKAISIVENIGLD